MQTSKIEYLLGPDGKPGFSWNPIKMRCTPISDGCANCWHLRFARRHAGNTSFNKLSRAAYRGGSPALDSRELVDPLAKRKPSRIAVQFMGDLFHDSIEDETIDDIFAVMGLAGAERQCCRVHGCDHEDCKMSRGDLPNEPIQTFLVLTKRPERMREWFQRESIGRLMGEASRRIGWANDPEAMISDAGWPLLNVWVGVSVENQATADERIRILLRTPAAHRWVSVEPMLGQITMPGLDKGFCPTHDFDSGFCHGPCKDDRRLDWVVCGAETGPGKRKCADMWITGLRTQCREAGVSFFGKVDSYGLPIGPREML